MRIDEVLQLFHLIEEVINVKDITSEDYQLFKEIITHLNDTSIGELDTAVINGYTQNLRDSTNQSIAAGCTGKANVGFSRLASDPEAVAAQGHSDHKIESGSEERTTHLQELAKSLEEVKLLRRNIDNCTLEFSPKYETVMSRFRDFLRICTKNGLRSTYSILKNYNSAIKMYDQQKVQDFDRMNSSNPSHVDATIRELTPNVLMFLATVAKSKKGHEPWNDYINPEHYSELPDGVIGLKNYDPRSAAVDLIQLGFASKTEKKGWITLNKQVIKNTLSQFRKEVLSQIKGAALETPSDKMRTKLKDSEIKARNMIDYVASNVSTEIKQLAKSMVKSKFLSKEGDDGFVNKMIWKGYEDRVASLDISSDPNSPSARRKQEQFKKTNLSRAVDFVVARTALKLIERYIDIILGNKPSGSIVTDDGLKYINTAWGNNPDAKSIV